MKNVHIVYVLLGLLAVGVITIMFVWDFSEEKKEIETTEEMNSVNTDDELVVTDDVIDTPEVKIVGKSMLDTELNLMMNYPDGWQVGNSREFGYSDYYLYAKSNLGELEKGYDLNTLVEISQCQDNYQVAADKLEQKYTDAKAVANVVPGWSEVNWWRQTEEVQGNFDWPVEMVKMENNAPIEGVAYSQYSYYMQVGATDCVFVELTVPKVQAILDNAKITHIDQAELERQGFYVVNNLEFQ